MEEDLGMFLAPAFRRLVQQFSSQLFIFYYISFLNLVIKTIQIKFPNLNLINLGIYNLRLFLNRKF